MTDEPNRTSRPHDEPAWTRALRETPPACPAACPDLAGRVQGRVRRVRAARRGGLLAALLLVAGAGALWQWQPAGDRPGQQLASRPVEPAGPAVSPVNVTPKRPAAESLAVPSPVARLDILSDQQSAVWASLEKLTEEL